jgi:hypothetical protein
MKPKAPAITRPALPSLKPCISLSDDPFSKTAPMVTCPQEQIDGICALRHELLLEKAKNMALQQQIEEMTQFLADYGLKWVGGPAPPRHNSPPDRGLFIQKVEALNCLVDRSKLEFSQTGNVCCLRPTPKVELALYEQGFTVDSGELREYGAPLNAAFIRDIMDGFFPAEFKSQYPEGVRFVVSDHCETFKGQPHSLDERQSCSCLEMLPPPTDIGTGDGELKLRIPSMPDVTIKVEKEVTIEELMELVEHNFDIRNFKIASPLVPGGYDSAMTLESAGLYPRGFAFVLFA